jgi:hypothetical protein
VTRGLWRAAVWAVGAGLAAALVAIVRPGNRSLILDVYLLFLGGLALVLLVAAAAKALPRAGRSRLEQALRQPPRKPARPGELLTLERRVLLATETAFEVHYRLRPVLREIAAHRLSAHRGIDLDHDVDAARAVLGPEAWELVRPDRPPPPDRLGRGRPLAELRAAVDALERI